ncbi:MAG TPA: response regulator [Verrucomicrobiae bacterium]|nr:response regulator [Verrucomicrobiae bacterium]
MTAAALPEVSACTPPAAIVAGAAGRKIRTLVADDQQLEREVMRRYLGAEADIELVGTAVNGLDAVAAIKRLDPDLVFLDVQMPEMDGFGVVSNLDPEHKPVVIFVTANEEFAHKAFDVQALDYLIKPCRRERLQVALQRARSHIQTLDEQRQNHSLRRNPGTPERIAVKTDGRILLMNLSDIEWIEAADDGVRLHAGRSIHFSRDTMNNWEQRLPVGRFLRINRGELVNMDHIRELRPIARGEYVIVLHGGAQLTLTRSHRDQLHRLGL